MQGRINKKFVTLLIASVAVLTAGLAGAWYFWVRTSPTDNLAQGDSFMKQALYSQAIASYGKAVSKRPNDVPILLKYLDALTLNPVTDAKSANQVVSQLRENLDRATKMQPDNPEPFDRLMRIYMRIGRELGEAGAWTYMLDRCQGTLNAIPNMQLAIKYRGISQVHRMRLLDVSPQDQELAKQDLLAYLQQEPADQDGLLHLALWNLSVARANERAGLQPEKVQELRRQAREITDRINAAGPDDLRRQIDRVLILRDLQDKAAVTPILEQIENRLLANPEPAATVIEFQEILKQFDLEPVDRGPSMPHATRGLQRAESLLRAADKKNPDNIKILFALGQTLGQQQSIDQSLEILKKAQQLPINQIPLDALSLLHVQTISSIYYTDLLLTKSESLTDKTARNTLLQEVQQQVDQLSNRIGENSAYVNLLSGKLAMAQGKWAQATIMLDRASSQFKETNIDVILLSAKVRLLAGEPGAAADRLRTILQSNPQLVPLRIELAKIELQVHELESASRDIDILMLNKPEDPQVLRLKAALLAQQNQIEQAIEIYQKLEPEKHPELLPQLASLHTAAGRPEVAQKILSNLFESNPSDIRTLQMALRLAPSKEAALALIEKSRAAGGNPQVLDALTNLLRSKAEFSDSLEEMITREPDEFQRSLQLFAMYRQTGQTEKAQEVFDKAARLQPDHPLIIETQFINAIQNKDWNSASTASNRAATLNLDLGKGMFYQGRLHLAKSEFSQAAASFRKGLQDRPVFSDGWNLLAETQRQLGDLSESLASFRKALDQKPNNVTALKGLATILDALQDKQGAIESLKKAVSFSPNDRALVNQYLFYEELYGDLNQALRLRLAIDQASDSEPNNRRALAVIQAKLNQPEQALQSIKELIAKEGNNLPNLAAQATIMKLSGNLAGAKKMLYDHVQGLQSANKAQTEDWLMLAKFLLGSDDERAAIDAFNHAVALEDPDKRPVSRELADLLFDRGLFNNAVEYYQKLFNDPKHDARVGQRYAEALIRANRFDDADKALQQVITESGSDANTYILEGLIARARGNDDKAVNALRAATELSPSRAILHYQLAEQLASKPEREKQALDSISRALDLDPQFTPARMLLTRIKISRRDYPEAIRELKLVLKNNPQYLPARSLLTQVYADNDQGPELRALLEDTISLFPRETYWLRLQAQQALQNGRTNDAYESLAKAVRIAPSPENLTELCSLLLTTDQPAAAAELLDKYAAAVPKHPGLLSFQGRILASQNKLDQARQAFAQAIELAHGFPQINAINDQLVLALGRTNTQEFLQPYVLGPKAVWIELVIAMNQIADSRFAQAIEHIEKLDLLLQRDTQEKLIADRLSALAFHRLGQYEKAQKMYTQVIEADPNHVPTINNLAYLLIQNLGQVHEGHELAERAIRLSPNDPQVLDTLGWAQLKIGRTSDAVKTLQRSIQLLPQSTNHYHLAEALLTSGDNDQAADHFKTAIDLARQSNDSDTLELAAKRLATLQSE